AAGGRLRRCVGGLGGQGAVQLDLRGERRGVVGEAPEILLGGGPLAVLFAQQILVEDQVEGGRWLGAQLRVAGQVVLRRHPLPRLPALPPLGAQPRGALTRRPRAGPRQEG